MGLYQGGGTAGGCGGGGCVDYNTAGAAGAGAAAAGGGGCGVDSGRQRRGGWFSVFGVIVEWLGCASVEAAGGFCVCVPQQLLCSVSVVF